jgi:hypothetical protein
MTFFSREESMFDQLHAPGRTSLHERKLAAWALFVGEIAAAADRPDRSTRSHRAMLPDVDPALAEAAPRRSLLARLKAAFRRRDAAIAKPAVSAGPAGLSAFDSGPVGKAAAIAYIEAADNDPGRDGFAASGRPIVVDQFRAA